MSDREHQLAESVRDACVAAAREAYDDAGIRGLCAEGRWEAALGAIQMVDLRDVASKVTADRAASDRG